MGHRLHPKDIKNAGVCQDGKVQKHAVPSLWTICLVVEDDQSLNL